MLAFIIFIIIHKEYKFFEAGCRTDSESVAYLADSLFDDESLENVGQRREYHFEWDEHFKRVTNVVMQTRTPAFAMDYFYLMEIPEDFSGNWSLLSYKKLRMLYIVFHFTFFGKDKSSGFSVNDLEYSNLKERTVNRILIGPANLDITSSVYHRLNLIIQASKPYDYVPYSKSSEGILTHLYWTLIL